MAVRAPLLHMDADLVRGIASRFDTPVVVYGFDELQHRVSALRRAIPSFAKLVYSVKANPNPVLLQFFASHGLYFETASAGEFLHVVGAGISADRVLFGGPVKRQEGLSAALRQGALAFNVESENDLAQVATCARDQNAHPSILLRVNPRRAAEGAILHMGGAASQFGIDEERIEQVIANIGGDVALSGLFMYAGSQYFHAADIVDNTRHLCRLAIRLTLAGLLQPTMLDFGGGFGVPEDDTQPDLDLQALRRELDGVFAEDLPLVMQSGLEHAFFESGRFLVASSAVLITRIVDVKESRGSRFVIVDAGLNNLGVKQMMYRTFEPTMRVMWPKRSEEVRPAVVVGPTCTPVDVVHKSAYLPDVSVGDLLGIGNCGAYLLPYSPINFCGHPVPAEVMIDSDGHVRPIGLRGSLDAVYGSGVSAWTPTL